MPGPTLAQRLATKDAQRFVGRERELAFFDTLFVDDPPASVVLVHGPGGIGKSTLLREITRRGEEKGWTPYMVEGRELAPVPGEIERALGEATEDEQPLILFDTYERMAAAAGYLRGRLLPTLSAKAIVVLAGRQAPEPEWFQNGWEQIAVEIKLSPLPPTHAMSLVRAHGLIDEELARRLVTWADGSPLALALAADAMRDGGSWQPDRIEEHPNLVQAIIRRLAQTELDGGNLDVAGVAAIARSCDARMLRDVLPDVDPDEAQEWLRTRTFSEPIRSGVTLHEIVRRAMAADLRSSAPSRERELRRRIADHLHDRAVRGEPRLWTDLAELVENPVVRWGLGAEGSVHYRPDLVRDDDPDGLRSHFEATHGGLDWWERTTPFLRDSPENVVIVRNAADELCGLCIFATPDRSGPVAEADVLLGPWLAHARKTYPGEQVLLWRDSIDFAGHGDLSSPVLAIMNTAAILRCGLSNPRRSYIPIDPENEAAMQFIGAIGADPVPELDLIREEKSTHCYVMDHGPGGILGSTRDTIYHEIGVTPPAPAAAEPDQPATSALTVADVRDALRNLDHPLDLAASPMASGDSPEERAASVRAKIVDAVEHAFGETADEQLMRRCVERGYLDPAASHELAADELHVSRATYFRRLRAASQRVADYLIATHSS